MFLPSAFLFSLLTLPLTPNAFAETPCTVLTSSADAEVKRCFERLKVVRLRGGPVARARRMGELLRGPLSPDVVNYFAYKASELAEGQAGFAGKLAILAYNQVVRILHRRTPSFLAEEIDAMALGMGVDPIVLRRGLSLPDTGVLIQGLGSHPWLEFLPTVGCTSAVVLPEHGGLVWGRNLDFAGVGAFDRHPMALVIEPEAGSSELRHVVLGADGLLFGGITGVNEAGIAFAIHQNFSRDVSLTGVPMILIGEILLRHARTLGEAEEILRRYRPASLWTFVVGDLNRGEMMAVESSGRHFLSRRSTDSRVFVQTNHNMHEETRAWENSDIAVLSNSIHRMKKAFETLEISSGSDAAQIASVLAYQENSEGYISSYHDILKSETIQTVLFEALPGGARTLYLSVDDAPSSGGKFAAFPLASLLAGGPLPDPTFVDLVRTSPERRVRQREISQAYAAYFDQQRPLDAAAILEGHPTLDAALFRASAFFRAGEFEKAITLAEQGAGNPRFLTEPAYVQESLVVVRIASYLRLGRRDDARRLAEQIDAKGPAKALTRRLVGYVLRNESPPGWLLNLNFNFFSGDLGGRKD